MSLPRYQEYKNSGVPWLGDVPAHWECPPMYLRYEILLGKMLDAKQNVGASPLPYLRNVDVQWERINTEDLPTIDISPDEHDRYTVRAGDLLVCEGGEVGRAAIWQGEVAPCAFQKALHRLRALAPSDAPHYLRYVLRHAAALGVFEAGGNPNTIPHLTAEAFRRYRFPQPPRTEQDAIVGFLDRETAKIDALIADQERLVALLDEKRQAVITQAVTKGLDPTVPMKDSGVEWIGEVPAHWEVPPLRQLARLESGHTPSRQRPEWWQNCTIPWFTLSDIWQVREEGREVIHETSERVSELGLANSSARLLPERTVMLSRTASVGFAAVMGQPMATSQDFANWVCGPDLSPSFLLRVFQAMAPEFARLKFGSTHNTIYMPDIAAFRCPAPPRPEQERIVAYLQDELNSIRTLRESSLQAIDLLRERRSALVSAAVTGQIDVRGLVEAEAA